MKSLTEILNDLENKISQLDAFDEKISKSNVAWHIDHSLKVILAVSAAIKKSNPSEYQWKFNFKRQLVYTLGFIPRGKGKAPKAVQSFDVITKETIEQQLKEASIALEEIQQLDGNSYFQHPYFGSLNLKPTLKFLNIHTQHHLKIIDDILKK
jgi:DNA-directed RNA polymerase specialized sigma subunit